MFRCVRCPKQLCVRFENEFSAMEDLSDGMHGLGIAEPGESSRSDEIGTLLTKSLSKVPKSDKEREQQVQQSSDSDNTEPVVLQTTDVVAALRLIDSDETSVVDLNRLVRKVVPRPCDDDAVFHPHYSR